MVNIILVTSVIILLCVIFNRISSRLGIPMLLAFILLGMFFGSDGIVKIPFDDYTFAEQVCSIALIFIIFYGGFGTKWSEAAPVAVKSILLSSVGTIMTAGLVGLFCYFVLKIDLLESFLIGSVISSTDAASVFSILRSKHLNLKYHTASLLELESGSNDPFSYMLTVIVLSIMSGNVSLPSMVKMLIFQLIFGIAFGILIAFLSKKFMRHFPFSTGFDSVFLIAVALLSYAIPSILGGNGYLSAYLTGILLGNTKLQNKATLVNFFDGITSLMQMLLFFLLGLLSYPSELPKVVLPALGIALFLTFIARPLTVCLLLTPFHSNLKQQFLVSWSGLRGAASIVFAIITVIHPAVTDNDIFHIVFCIVLFSILIQGSLIPLFARVLHMTDDASDVMKTFSDYMEEVPIQFIHFKLSTSHPWNGKALCDIILPPDSLLVLILRNQDKLIPNGQTILQENDTLVLSGKALSSNKLDGICLYEKTITKEDVWNQKAISDISLDDSLIMVICRDDKFIIPKGNTILLENDRLVINEPHCSIS